MTEFQGFPDDGIRFLRSLRRSNRRDWFQSRKEIYQTELRAPMEALVSDIGDRLRRSAPEFSADPRRSIYRIYRDTRFSHDKKPYKTHIAAIFPHNELGKHEGAAFYVHVAPDEVFAGGGLYRPQPRDLQAVRVRLSSDGTAFRRIVTARAFRTMFGELRGERLQRVPRGFPRDHESADLLRHKQFLASRQMPEDLACSPRFLQEVLRTFRALLPMCRFLNDAILEGRAGPHLRPGE